MKKMTDRNRLDRLEQEIFRKERLAREARSKGMKATFGNYMNEISWLKVKLQHLRTDPSRIR